MDAAESAKFEAELLWCMEQLAVGLASGKLTDKQGLSPLLNFSCFLQLFMYKETQFRSFSVKVPLFTKRLRDLFLERSEIVPRQSDGRPEGSHNKQLILSHRKK